MDDMTGRSDVTLLDRLAEVAVRLGRVACGKAGNW